MSGDQIVFLLTILSPVAFQIVTSWLDRREARKAAAKKAAR